MAPQADEVHIESLGQLSQSSADVAEADDKERLAAEFVLALGEIADHPPPDRFPWLSRASGRRRLKASISDIACSATARALTPRALASRMPRFASSLRGNWSVPAPID